MDPTTWLILLVAAYLSQIIGTVTGFGSATLLLPVAAAFIDLKTAIPLVALFHIAANAARIAAFHERIDVAVCMRFGIPAVLLSIAGAGWVLAAPSRLLQLLLGIFLTGYALVSLVAPRALVVPVRPSTVMAGGAISGLFTGLLGTGGPVRAVALDSLRLPKLTYLGTSAVLALAADLARVPVYWSGGLVRREHMPLILGWSLVAIIGVGVGRRLAERLSARHVRLAVLLFLGILGIRFLIEGWRG